MRAHQKKPQGKTWVKVLITVIVGLIIVASSSIFILFTQQGNLFTRKLIKDTSYETIMDKKTKDQIEQRIKVIGEKNGGTKSLVYLAPVIQNNRLVDLFDNFQEDSVLPANLQSMGAEEKYAVALSEFLVENASSQEIIKDLKEAKYKEAVAKLDSLIQEGKLDNMDTKLDSQYITDVDQLHKEAREILNSDK